MLQNGIEFDAALNEFKTMVVESANNFTFAEGRTLRVVNFEYNNDENKGSSYIGVYVRLLGKTPVGGSFDKDLIKFYAQTFDKSVLEKLEIKCNDLRALPDYEQSVKFPVGGCYWYQFS